ncbi:MAG: hypothetical protein AB7G68_12460 [Nitrospiraceae bacterium]
MANQSRASLIELLDDPQFIKDSLAYWDAYQQQARRIGADKEEWNRQAEAFMSRHLDPFAQRWSAYPPPIELLVPDRIQRYAYAAMNGQWGIVPIYPWTTQQEVIKRLRKIQRVIGKKHGDTETLRQERNAHIAKWLENCHVSTNTGEKPPRNEIASAVWNRKTGLKRPSLEHAIEQLSEEKETRLLRRYQKEGKTRPEAQRLIYKTARGSEAPASASVRMAMRRLPFGLNKVEAHGPDPRKADPVGVAATLLLRALKPSDQALDPLNPIHYRAAKLCTLLLSPDPSKDR